MIPIDFTIKNGITHFHYKPSELIDFVRRGKKYGNVGIILTKRENNVLTYRGFGTIENPDTNIKTLITLHSDAFNGKLPSDEEMLIEEKDTFNRKIINVDMVTTDELMRNYRRRYYGVINKIKKIIL